MPEVISYTIHSPEVLSGQVLPVMESFYTIQGEGYHQGKAAYFIRLAGCDVGCVWCDVKESWPADAHPFLSIEAITNEVLETSAPLVVITGGEPLMYNIAPLVAKLQAKGISVNIETSGAYPLSGAIDWICFSPKKFKKPLAEFYPKAHELKVVIFNKSDFAWAETHAEQVSENCLLYLQPEWSKEAELLPQIIDYVKQNPKWRISLQVHKYMQIP
jgi:organic radical activating enzyme